MKKIPNFQTALLELSSLFVSPGWQASERRRYASGEMREEKRNLATGELSVKLFRKLSLGEDQALAENVLHQILLLGQLIDILSLHAITYGAEGPQVLWQLGRQLAPHLGRTWGFWCCDIPIAPQMPGGDLWFLPRVSPDQPDRLVLPVEVVARWWREMLNAPLEKIWDVEDDRHRTFQQWLSGRHTPTPEQNQRLFPDGQEFPWHAEITSPPSVKVVRNLMLWARALETLWKEMVKELTPDVDPTDPDPMRNKVLQLAELFRRAHQLTVAAKHDHPVIERRRFRELVPSWLAYGDFSGIMPDENANLLCPEGIADVMSRNFQALEAEMPLPDIFGDSRMTRPADQAALPAAYDEREELGRCIRAAFAALDSDAEDRERVVSLRLQEARKHPRYPEFAVQVELLAAHDAIARDDLEAMRGYLEAGRKQTETGNHGFVEYDLARTSVALAVYRDPYDQNRFEKDWRIVSRCLTPAQMERWQVGNAPSDHSMRLAAVDISAEFWEAPYRPYHGVTVAQPMSENSPMFEDFVRLIVTGAGETEVRSFLKAHEGVLGKKLRNGRGDTLLTLTMKMMPDFVATMKKMPAIPLPGSVRLSAPEQAARMRSTWLTLVRLMPKKLLEASDWRNQTGLMLAANRRDHELVQLLLDRKVKLDAQDSLGRMALHSAVLGGDVACYRFLLSAGANPSPRTCAEKTPLMLAAELGREGIFKLHMQEREEQLEEEELRACLAFARPIEANYKHARKAYRMQDAELGGRPAYRAIIKELEQRLGGRSAPGIGRVF